MVSVNCIQCFTGKRDSNPEIFSPRSYQINHTMPWALKDVKGWY
ncbi:hypothetical protein GDO86_010166 [Hymenochirus boettgeri]|uniref:Uncharacterized protein n=1 Tax=Hymenochirus boettgeri TaxID=247094 RepID=A0A8T2JND4_9PIPI|nr:hypothetical protein GDO86_010166 [Hymenochirus boettgeri]